MNGNFRLVYIFFIICGGSYALRFRGLGLQWEEDLKEKGLKIVNISKRCCGGT